MRPAKPVQAEMLGEGSERILSPHGLQRCKAWREVFPSPVIDLPKVPEANLGLQLGSPSRQKGASSEGQSASGALSPQQP